MMMAGLFQDLRYGARTLMKNPAFTLAAVLTLALGIGANTAIFSVVNAVLLRPLPYEDPERLVMIYETNLAKGWPQFSVSPPNFADWSEQSRVFDGMTGFRGAAFNLTGVAEPERISGMFVSKRFFGMVGVRPLLGRTFTPDEDEPGKENRAVLAYGLWQRRFGGDLGIVGKPLTLNGDAYTVVGVMPAGFALPRDTEIWAPLSFRPGEMKQRGSHYMSVLARLKPGVTLETAQTEMSAIAGRLEKEYPDSNSGWGARVVPLLEQAVAGIRPALLTLLGAVGFVLLIACANVANLLLARAEARRREMAVRAALGAGRPRLIRQLLTECVLLALVGGGLGLLLAVWGIDALRALEPADLPRLKEIRVDLAVLGFTAAASLVTGLIFGLAPAIQISRTDLNVTLREGERGSGGSSRGRVRGALVVAEIALALVLLIGAGLHLRSLHELQGVDPGFDTANLLTMRVSLPGSKYSAGAQGVSFYRQALERLDGLPGVRSAAAVSSLPLSDYDLIFTFHVEGRPPLPPSEQVSADWHAVSRDYFRTMGIPLVRGRFFTERDDASAPRVAIINETMARRTWPGEDPIGRRISIGIGPEALREVVGVVKDVKQSGLDADIAMQVYEPYPQQAWQSMFFVLRAESVPEDLSASARRAILDVDKDQPVFGIRTMDQILSGATAQRRFNMLLLCLFAAVALALAAVGVYGVIAYSVAQRTHEIGIRMALGAQRRDVLGMVARQGLPLAVMGIASGLAGAAAVTRLMTSLLFGVSATDPATVTATALLMAAVAALACYIPARRATKVDPMTALRCEG